MDSIDTNIKKKNTWTELEIKKEHLISLPSITEIKFNAHSNYK